MSYGEYEKKIVFGDTDKRHADLRIRLHVDELKQGEFFRAIVTGYIEQDEDLLKFLDKYKSHADIYVKGTPIHVRGALLYNYYVRKNKVSHKYAPIQEGEKIKFLYLKEPNPIGENVVSFMGTIPREFKVDKYIDYNLQFNKSFYEPLKNVLQCIGWDSERKVSLLQFI